MTNSTANFTAAQVLQAARRAEAEGKTEYALQFYRHLVDHYPDAPEAHEAREGLQRIARWRPPPPGPGLGGPERGPHQPGPRRGAAPMLPGADAPTRDVDPYRFGRLASRVFGWLGGLITIAGFAFAGYIGWTAPPQLWTDSMIGFPMPLFWGLVVGMAGFGILVAGQVASAVFDGAEAVNVLLEDERYRS